LSRLMGCDESTRELFARALLTGEPEPDRISCPRSSLTFWLWMLSRCRPPCIVQLCSAALAVVRRDQLAFQSGLVVDPGAPSDSEIIMPHNSWGPHGPPCRHLHTRARGGAWCVFSGPTMTLCTVKAMSYGPYHPRTQSVVRSNHATSAVRENVS
jgi:hypothetical protein